MWLIINWSINKNIIIDKIFVAHYQSNLKWTYKYCIYLTCILLILHFCLLSTKFFFSKKKINAIFLFKLLTLSNVLYILHSERIIHQLVYFISKMSTSKQPSEKRRRTAENDSDEGGICNFLKKVKNKIKYFNWFYFIVYKVNDDKYEKTFSKLLYQNSKILIRNSPETERSTLCLYSDRRGNFIINFTSTHNLEPEC